MRNFLLKNIGAYTMVTSGSNCGRVTSKAECEEAARQLGLSDNVASEESVSNWPPYCYFYNERSLWFNNYGDAVSQCTNSAACICKEISSKRLFR